MSLNAFVRVDLVTLVLIAFACFGHAQPSEQNETLMFADDGRVDTTSKELYENYGQAFYRNLRDNDEAELKAVAADVPAVMEPPPKPRQIDDWPKQDLHLGQVTAVAIHPDGNPVLFHRHDRVWNEEWVLPASVSVIYNLCMLILINYSLRRTFNQTNHYQFTHLGPIAADTIVKLHANTGETLDSWGSILFYMPHGMTIDCHGNTWVTDVALHQVFKFHPNSKYPALTIGRRFQPGSLPNHLCQPTSVAIASTGEVRSTIEVNPTPPRLTTNEIVDIHRFLSATVTATIAFWNSTQLDVFCVSSHNHQNSCPCKYPMGWHCWNILISFASLIERICVSFAQSKFEDQNCRSLTCL